MSHDSAPFLAAPVQLPSAVRPESDLTHAIASIRMCDTHEHLRKSADWVEHGPDVLQDLFTNYARADLASAGASQDDLAFIFDAANLDIEARFKRLKPYWEAIRWTGYGEAVRLQAKLIYGIDELTPSSIAGSEETLLSYRQPGGRLRILQDIAGLDHVQIDDFTFSTAPDDESPDFFLKDVTWTQFSNGSFNHGYIQRETGVEIVDLHSLKRAMEAVLERHGPRAVAIKTQHAYQRSLEWQPRSDIEARHALERLLVNGRARSTRPSTRSSTGNAYPESTSDRLCIGDWCLDYGLRLAGEWDLPVKIHTGILAGNDGFHPAAVNPAHLAPLFKRHPKTRFVLMHTGYPHFYEFVSLVKHFPNVYADLCWAWSIDPIATTHCVRSLIHAVPTNKVFGFGGDTVWPTAAAAFAAQCRSWFARAMWQEVDEGYMSERQAIDVARRVLRANQREFFDRFKRHVRVPQVPPG